MKTDATVRKRIRTVVELHRGFNDKLKAMIYDLLDDVETLRKAAQEHPGFALVEEKMERIMELEEALTAAMEILDPMRGQLAAIAETDPTAQRVLDTIYQIEEKL